jgi:hypothetical protein
MPGPGLRLFASRRRRSAAAASTRSGTMRKTSANARNGADNGGVAVSGSTASSPAWPYSTAISRTR